MTESKEGDSIIITARKPEKGYQRQEVSYVYFIKKSSEKASWRATQSIIAFIRSELRYGY